MQELEDFESKEYQGHKKSVFSLDWNNIGNRLASASSDGTIRIWYLEQTQLEKGLELKGHNDMIEQIRFSPENPNILGSVSSDKTLRIWDIRSNKSNIKTEKTKGSNINLNWSKDGSLIAIGNKEDLLTIYNYRQQQIQKQIQFDVHINQVNEICWDHTNSYLMVTTGSDVNNSGPIYLLDGKQPDLPYLHELQAHQGTSLCISVDPTGQYFATGAEDSIVALWDAKQFIQLGSITKIDNQIRQFSFNFNGSMIAVASDSDEILIFSTNDLDSKTSIQCKAKQNTVCWHPNMNLLAYAGEDKSKFTDERGVINLYSEH